MIRYNETKEAQVRGRFAATILIVSMAGCASQPIHLKTTPKPPEVSVVRRVTLPYTFTRHGVEVRVNSIEFADNQMLVNVELQETRGQTVEFPVSTLMQTLTAAGHELPYFQYSRAGEIRTDPEIHMAAHDQFPITLFYQPSPGSAGAPGDSYELRFPTGKYWSSQAE
jgi:hypothetical protein